MSVEHPSFQLEAQARDCPRHQFVREFTKNGLEAIETRRTLPESDRNPGREEIVWRQHHELGDRLPAPKLACIDTGTGMTPDELERYINSLTATSKTRALDANYGMGAKIAGSLGNPAGLAYFSWTGSPDDGYTCTLARDETTGDWGLEEDPVTGEILLPVDPELCPVEIVRAGWRGTAVIFLGQTLESDTMQPPLPELGVDWI